MYDLELIASAYERDANGIEQNCVRCARAWGPEKTAQVRAEVAAVRKCIIELRKPNISPAVALEAITIACQACTED